MITLLCNFNERQRVEQFSVFVEVGFRSRGCVYESGVVRGLAIYEPGCVAGTGRGAGYAHARTYRRHEALRRRTLVES